ncbi:MAG: hypothetical protein HC835_16500 [Oscillatoriales cyanobacterium RM2_1_1]|nr:hypothetical protein [Oscillatoriales cyanobacterium SM2_3_0]NJO47087.1 hypothetical protein [Oscillatoriales cyanobacterium RM2_1_1]
MDVLVQQLVTLNRKIDVLYELIMQVNEKVAPGLPVDHFTTAMAAASEAASDSDIPSSLSIHTLKKPDPEFEHKDVLSDDYYLETGMTHRQDPGLTSDIQIQRLTAQLTAAYNRIAALEEQLLAKRVHF